MALAAPEYRWIAGSLQLLELDFGPFWDPARPHSAANPDDILVRAQETESLLQRLVVGRRKSFAIVAVLGFLCLGSLFTLPAVPEPALDLAVGILMTVCVAVWVWLRMVYWRAWFFLFSPTLPASPPAPAPVELVDNLRRLCDQLAVMGDAAAIRALLAMRDVAPLTYEACMRLTVVGSSVQRAVRAD